MNTPMTPEQKIITIAKFEGWKQHTQTIWVCSGEEPAIGIDNLPPYLTSRDAICGAVARLDEHKSLVFVYKLDDLLKRKRDEPTGCEHWTATTVIDLILADPDQLADALLLTLGHEI